MQKKPINLKTWVIQRLRGQSYKWPYRNSALVAARVDRGLYKCAICSEIFKRDGVQLDHIKPVIPLTGWDNWDGFITRLFCEEDGYQVICLICHNVKTTTEDTIRAKNNAERKAKEKELKKKNIVDKKKEE